MSEGYYPEVEYGREFVMNGYLVVCPMSLKMADEYLGIEDDDWPIMGDSYRRFADTMGVPEQGLGIQVATLWDRVLAYWRDCVVHGIRARLLLVSTRYLHPTVVPPVRCWERLGYDLAEPLGSHSVVRNELIAGSAAPRIRRWRSRLNAFGLFDDLETCEAFMNERRLIIEADETAGYSAPGFKFVPVLLHRYTGE